MTSLMTVDGNKASIIYDAADSTKNGLLCCKLKKKNKIFQQSHTAV